MPILAWMITLGTWNFLQNGFFTNFYDVQARALLHGRWYVPPGAVSIEGFVIKGHTYIYFGPFPALIRIPILLFTSSLDGRLTQVSMLLAILVALIASARLAWKVRNLVSSAPVSIKEAAIYGCSMVVLALGSVFILLTSNDVIYNEAEAWGAALAIAAFDALLGFLVHPSTRGVLIAGALTTCDLLTRGSVGLGPVAALGVLAILHGSVSAARRGVLERLPTAITRHVPTFRNRTHADQPNEGDPDPAGRLSWMGIPDASGSPTRTFALACVVVVPLGLYGAVNVAKFGTLFSVPFTHQVYAHQNAALHAALSGNAGSLLGLKFVPTALLQYLRPDALRTNRLFPFVGFPGPATVIGPVVYDSRTWTSSITSTMPAIVASGAVGLWSVFRPTTRNKHGQRQRQRRPKLALLRVPVVGAFVGILGSLAYAFIAERYLADWMPLLILAGCAGLAVVMAWSRSAPRRARRAAMLVGAALAIFGVLTNVALSILAQRELTTQIPTTARAQFVNLQSRIDQALFGNPPQHVAVVKHLPGTQAAGALAILGNCAALYQSNGLGWNAVERSAAVGHYELRVSFGALHGSSHHTYWPLVVTGRPTAGDYLAVRSRGPNLVEFAYLYQVRFKNGRLSQFWFSGSSLKVDPRRFYAIDVVLDDNIGQGLDVTVDGQPVITAPQWLVRAPLHPTFGVDAIGGPTARIFPGRLEHLSNPPLTTCAALFQRLRPSRQLGAR